MSNPLYAFPTTCEQTLRALARYPSAHGVQLARRIADLSGRHRPDRPHAGRVHEIRLCARHPRRLSHRQPRRHLVRRRRRAIGAAVDHLAASDGFAGRPAVPARGFRSADAGRRRRHLPRPRRRARRQSHRPEDRVHARPGLLRRRPARGDRGRRQRHRALVRRARRHRHAELHRRHDRQIQGHRAPSPRTGRLRQRHPRRLRNSGNAELSRRWRRSAMSPAPKCCRP